MTFAVASSRSSWTDLNKRLKFSRPPKSPLPLKMCRCKEMLWSRYPFIVFMKFIVMQLENPLRIAGTFRFRSQLRYKFNIGPDFGSVFWQFSASCVSSERLIIYYIIDLYLFSSRNQ